jgi:hypothetical protein
MSKTTLTQRLPLLLLSVALGVPATAQDEPKPVELERAHRALLDARVRAAVAGAAQPAPPADVKTESIAYVGVSTSLVTPVLTDQLRLTPGLGLVVEFVEPGSPAATAGVKAHDILTQLDDQRLANPEQLRTLVRLKRSGDAIKLSFVRQGQPQTATVKLSQREIAVGLEDQVAARVQDALAFMPSPGATGANHNYVLGQFRNTATGQNLGGGRMLITNVDGKTQTVFDDGRHSLTIEMKDGKASTLVARAADGKEVFNGPVETDEQRKAIPPDVAEKLKRAEAGGPLRTAHTYRLDATAAAAARPRIVTSNDKDALLVARFENGKAAYALVFSTATGKTLFDGPAATDEQRKAMPEAFAKQLEILEKNQAATGEFGVGRR